MDETLAAIVDFVAQTDDDAVPDRARALIKLHLTDAIACGAGAYPGVNAQKVRQAISGVTSTPGASAYGIAARTTPELAGFVNATLNRSLDYNDFGPSGHPSDMMPSLLAVAEDAGATGADVVRGIHVAYEVATALADAAPIAEMRWDMGLYFTAAAAAGMASILRFDPATTAHAVSLAVVPNTPLRVTRGSPGSEWRSSATAYACMGATFASRMARAGLTGPRAPFEGPEGLFEVAIQPAGFTLTHGASDRSAVERGCLKLYAACFQAQSGIDAARRVGESVDPAAIESIVVDTTEGTWWYIGGGRGDRDDRWNPTTRESADHSLPYVVANVLLDGALGRATSSPERIASRVWQPLIRRVEVRADPELSAADRVAHNPTRVTVQHVDGRVVSTLSTFPYDDAGRSMVSAADVAAKFAELAEDVLRADDAEELLGVLTRLDTITDLDDVTSVFRRFGAARAAPDS